MKVEEVNEESRSASVVPIEVIVLNGSSSSGKTTLAEALQDILAKSWLVFGIDTLFSALPLSLLDIHRDATIGAHPRVHEVRDGAISFAADGALTVGAEFRRLEEALLQGLAAIAATGTRLILDEVFLEGRQSQERVRHAFAERNVVWVGVTCDVLVAAQRERERGDRVVGASEKQSLLVHEGVHYDLVVDTTSNSADELARLIAGHFRIPTA
jgi:chloramphenicol 3-O phosphotransferase